MPRVFLSYRHESDAHAAAVLALGEWLRLADVEVVLDQFLVRESPGGPDGGWPKWCENRAGEGKVLVCASPGWFAAWRGDAVPWEGRGAGREVRVLDQRLYDGGGSNADIRIVTLATSGTCSFPPVLAGYHTFRGHDPAVLGWLGGSAADWPAEPVELGWDMVDHTDIRRRVAQLLTREAKARLLVVTGESSTGKTTVTKQILRGAGEQRWLRVGRLDCKGAGEMGAEVATLAGQLCVPAPSAGGATGLASILESLRRDGRPTLWIMDTVEALGGLESWLMDGLLHELRRASWLRVVLAGKRAPDVRCEHEPLEIERPGPEHWLEYATRKRARPDLDLNFLSRVWRLVEGHPEKLYDLLFRGSR
jgi:hypothetical protein